MISFFAHLSAYFNTRRFQLSFLIITCLFGVNAPLAFADKTDELDSTLAPLMAQVRQSAKSSVMVEASIERPAIHIREDMPLLPASTLKILTAYLAIQRWGLDHHFTTDFYVEGSTLWIKGYGDPYLVSEELLLIKSALAPYLRDKTILQIGIDTSAFPDVDLGRGDSDNPYDAGNAALALNFNSVNLIRQQGVIQSAEPQTPITALAQTLGQEMAVGSKAKRVSLPGGREMSAQYFAEVFSQIVFDQDLPIRIGLLPQQAQPIYQHHNSKNLEQVLIAMLKYSNNFIANQLFLMMASDQLGTALSATELVNNARHYAMTESAEAFGWKNYSVVDGAGLSRDNYLSAEQMMVLLEHFRPWRYLLPQRNSRVQAKTGTLTGVRTYAGYYQDASNEWRAFALMMNEQIAWRFRYAFADALAN